VLVRFDDILRDWRAHVAAARRSYLGSRNMDVGFLRCENREHGIETVELAPTFK
jgi:hypothetical protein